MSKFMREQLRIIDKYIRQSHRIRVLWEFSREEVLQMGEAGKEFIVALDESFSYVIKGRFKQAFIVFKKAVVDYAEYNRKRDDRLAERIAAASEDQDVASIVGYMGSTHTRLGHILVREGYKVTRAFPEMKNGLYIWGPIEQASRYIQFSPNKELSEIQWHRFMIGAGIQAVYRVVQKKNGKEMSDQEIIQAIRKKLAQFKDMESIAQLERDIRRRGFTKAIFLPEDP